jgi:hypothetical protein
MDGFQWMHFATESALVAAVVEALCRSPLLAALAVALSMVDPIPIILLSAITVIGGWRPFSYLLS